MTTKTLRGYFEYVIEVAAGLPAATERVYATAYPGVQVAGLHGRALNGYLGISPTYLFQSWQEWKGVAEILGSCYSPGGWDLRREINWDPGSLHARLALHLSEAAPTWGEAAVPLKKFLEGDFAWLSQVKEQTA